MYMVCNKITFKNDTDHDSFVNHENVPKYLEQYHTNGKIYHVMSTRISQSLIIVMIILKNKKDRECLRKASKELELNRLTIHSDSITIENLFEGEINYEYSAEGHQGLSDCC